MSFNKSLGAFLHKYGTVSELNIADYENVFDYSFDFNSIWADKDLERKIHLFQQAIKIQKTSGDLFNYLPP